MPTLNELHDGDEDIAPSRRVIRSVAVLHDTNPLDLPPLQEVIDTTALDDLISKPGSDECEVGFEYAETHIYFSAGGDLTVTTADD